MITSIKVNFSKKKNCYVAKIQCDGTHINKRNYHFDNIQNDSMVHELNICIIFVLMMKDSIKDFDKEETDLFFENIFREFNEFHTMKVSQSLRFW
jgi:hypothetical protein